MKVYSVHAKKLFVKEEHLNFVSKLVVFHLPAIFLNVHLFQLNLMEEGFLLF